jgi:pimeloyl-ACP methyl ester carboxylesterase
MSRLILIPGLGANRLLFEPQRRRFDQELFLPDWPAPIATAVEGRRPVPESLTDYARRWADRWMQTLLAQPEARNAFWIAGVSLGGAIALEAARRLVEEGAKPRGLFLIASLRTSAALPLRFRLMASLIGLLPDKTIAKAAEAMAPRIARRERLSDIDTLALTKMARAADPAHTRWLARAAARWRFTDADAAALTRNGVPIHQIHGEHDWALPLQRGRPDKVLHGARHLINITHADEVNDYIRTRMVGDMAADDDE